MLTSDLSINWRKGDKIFPHSIKTDDANYQRDAEAVIEIFEDFEGKTRGELERELEEYIGNGTDFRVLRGFIKLLTDGSEFETASAVAPSDIRQKVFLAAREFQPVLPDSATKDQILDKAAEELNISTETIVSNLYSDLSANQKLITFQRISAKDLLDRYNLAQAQALLYKCVEMKIRVEPNSPDNYRAIFDSIKHFGLIHSISGDVVNGYEITLTGAASLFHRSQKYGVQMAVFLPALLLCENWKMTAEISQRQGANVFYEISSAQTKLKSCYADEPEYKNPDIEKLKKDWSKSSTDWELRENPEIVDLGKLAFIPDFVLSSPADDKKFFLDVLGFWTPKSLKKKLEECEAANFQNFIFAASHELRGSREEPLWESANVIFYKSKIEPRVLIETAENLTQTNRV